MSFNSFCTFDTIKGRIDGECIILYTYLPSNQYKKTDDFLYWDGVLGGKRCNHRSCIGFLIYFEFPEPVTMTKGSARILYPQQKQVKSDVCKCYRFQATEKQGDGVTTIYLCRRKKDVSYP